MDCHKEFLRKPFLVLILATVIAALFSTSAWGLPPVLEAKKNWLGVENALEKDDYAKALEYLENMNTLGVKLKPDYYFQYGRSLIKSGKSSKGLDYLNRYIEKAGEEGEYVEWALELMNEGEEQVAMAKKKEKEEFVQQRLAKIKAENEGPHSEGLGQLGLTPESEFFAQVVARLSLNVEKAVANKNYHEALVYVDKAQASLGRDSAVFHATKAKILIEKGAYEGARQELTMLRRYKDPNKLAIEIEIEKKIEPFVSLLEQQLGMLQKQTGVDESRL